ncbi:GTP-binding protein ypt2-like isoform X2 [Penaeus japonicus]|uniref:GTP-binding protein ypt2-like isoform X2 n=1 Tax=Penaeus japonicus TaxID=27405 RepID=UPI001C70D201|nr:GTP-binding protein ypt2-like isoform X2 [Penaeus japonicus]
MPTWARPRSWSSLRRLPPRIQPSSRQLVCGRKVKLQIWDTAGQRYAITTAYYRGARGILIVYDVTSEKSFENVKKWLDNVTKYSADNTIKMILGNNCHLKEDERQVSWERGKQLADEKGVKFMEVSAKTGQNIEETLNILSKSMLEQESSVIATGQRTSAETQGSRCSVQ